MVVKNGPSEFFLSHSNSRFVSVDHLFVRESVSEQQTLRLFECVMYDVRVIICVI